MVEEPIKELNRKYKNMTVESIVMYLRIVYPEIKSSEKGNIIIKSKIRRKMSFQCQVNLIDMQTNPDCDVKFIFVYQDHLKKLVLRPSLYSKTPDEIAYHFSIFSELFKCQKILHSNNRMKV